MERTIRFEQTPTHEISLDTLTQREIGNVLALLAIEEITLGKGKNPDDTPRPNGTGNPEAPQRDWTEEDAPIEHGPPEN
jgi:hypothetical protein